MQKHVIPSGVRVSMCLAMSSQLPKPNCSIASNNLTSSFADQLLRPKNSPNAPESYKSQYTQWPNDVIGN